MAVDEHYLFDYDQEQPTSGLRKTFDQGQTHAEVRAFHLALEKLLSSGEIEEDGGAIMRALNTVREDLIDLQQHNLALGHARAEEDPVSPIESQLVLQMLKHGAFSHQQLIALLESIMRQLCANGFECRRIDHLSWFAEVEGALASSCSTDEQASHIVHLIQGITYRIKQAKRDTANLKFRLQFESVRTEAVVFERQMVYSCLENGSLCLDATAKWLTLARHEMSLTRNLPDDIRTIHRYAVVKLIQPEVFGTQLHRQMPETMSFDENRMGQFRFELGQIASKAAMMSISTALMKKYAGGCSPMRLQQMEFHLAPAVVAMLWEPQSKALDVVAAHMSILIQECDAPEPVTEAALRRQLAAAHGVPGNSRTPSVLSLFMERTGFVLWRTLLVGGVSEGFLHHRGLFWFGYQLGSVCSRVAKLVVHLEHVFLPVYIELMQSQGEGSWTPAPLAEYPEVAPAGDHTDLVLQTAASVAVKLEAKPAQSDTQPGAAVEPGAAAVEPAIMRGMLQRALLAAEDTAAEPETTVDQSDMPPPSPLSRHCSLDIPPPPPLSRHCSLDMPPPPPLSRECSLETVGSRQRTQL